MDPTEATVASGSDEAILRARIGLAMARKREAVASKWLSGIAAAMGAAGIVGAMTNFVDDRAFVEILGDNHVRASSSNDNAKISANFRQLEAEVQAIRQAQGAITRLPPSDKTGVQISALAARVNAISQRQERLEQAIQNSPEKALSMPLMRRDIDNMRDSNAQSLAAIKASVDQVYDLTKWLLGALAVGVFSLAITNFFQRKS